MSAPTTTKPVTYKSSELGRTVVLTTYVDPCPGKIGTDKVPSPCGRCGGSGFFNCYGHIYGGRCFLCSGAGVVPTSVSTVRKHARSEAFHTEYADELAVVREAAAVAANAAIAAAEFAAAWDAAHAEAARRAALVQGFLGEVGDKIVVTGTVQVAKYISGSWNRSDSMFLIVKLDSGQVVKTFGSGMSLFRLERGYRVTLTGKVKAQETYQGQDQTVLSFAKATVLDEED